MAKIKLDLDPKFNKDVEVEAELHRVIAEAIRKRIILVDVVVGKDSGELKKHVLRFLARPDIKKLYFKIEVDQASNGRILIHFRHSNSNAFH